MAGRPRRFAMIAELLARTAKECDDTPDATPLDYVELFIASGKTLKALADELTKATKPKDPADAKDWNVSGEMVRRYLESLHGESETETRLARARARSSYAMVDEALAIAEDTVPEAAFVAKDRLRVQSRQWTAERFNPSVFGGSKGPTVSISIGSLHLAALQSSTARVTGALHGATQNSPVAGVEQVQPIAITSVSATDA